MKATCTLSHRVSGEEGKYQDYIAGQVYERPEEELGPYFILYVEPAPADEAPAPKKGGKK